MSKITVNVHEAKTQLSRLIERALSGDEVVIARAGVPAVVLSPARGDQKLRPLGLLKGQIRVDAGFDEDDPALEAAFRGDADGR